MGGLSGPLFEEPGWRGFSLPGLQAQVRPLRGSMLPGMLWGAWHLPQFLVPEWAGESGGLDLTSVAVFLLLVMALAPMMTCPPLLGSSVPSGTGRLSTPENRSLVHHWEGPLNGNESLTTDRLKAARIQPDDFAELSVLHHDQGVMATLGGVRSDDETRRFLREKIQHWDRYGFGMWMFRDKSTGAFVGRGGLQHIEVGGNEEVEVGYTVAAEHQGRGYATEMIRAMVAFGFETLGFTNLVAFTLPDNLASRRVMEKCGFEFERDIQHAGTAQVLYRLRR